jgi:hypothetical protein
MDHGAPPAVGTGCQLVAASHRACGQTGKNCNTFYPPGNHLNVREYLAGYEESGRSATAKAIRF